MKDNGGRRPEQILTEIHRTRDELEKTLTAIEHRLTPGQLVDHGIDYLRQSGANEFVHNLGGAAKQNPLPVALVGIGLAWLMALGRQPARSDGSGTSTSETLASTRERVSGTVSSMRERASEVSDTARHQWERARDGLDHLVHEQPLALGAIGLAIGAVLGAAAPRTRVEEQMMGQASRNLGDKAEQAVREVAQTAAPAQPQRTVPSQQVESKLPVQAQPGRQGTG
jgi:ElaB/YqjD/DUF883 family membrane-anchored ribosome-binding protein